jgi:hypothetical protein
MHILILVLMKPVHSFLNRVYDFTNIKFFVLVTFGLIVFSIHAVLYFLSFKMYTSGCYGYSSYICLWPVYAKIFSPCS